MIVDAVSEAFSTLSLFGGGSPYSTLPVVTVLELELPANPAAAAFRQGVLTDELASVRLKSACVKMAVSPTTSLVLAVTDKGIIPYNLKLSDGVPHFIMPQVRTVRVHTF